MNKLTCLLAFSGVLLLLSLVLAQTPLSSQQVPPPRGPDLIRELYEGDPLQRQLPGVAEKAMEEPEPQAIAAPPSWSKLTFQSFRNDNWDIYLINPDGSGTARVTSEASVEAYPELKRGCERVVFASDRTRNYEIYAQDTDGSDLLRLTHNSADDIMPAWSPDGSRIAFQSYRAGNSDIYVMNADGSNVTRLTSSGAYDGHPSWSPDGAQIVFSSFRTGRYELWIVDTTDLSLRQLTFGATALFPAWSPTGDKIAYANDGNGDGWLEIWLINTDGSSPERLVGDLYAVDRRTPSWSPDGKWLAIITTEWVQYGGQWYWTASYVRVTDISDISLPTLVKDDDRVWDAHWASTDASSPAACTVNAPAQSKWNSFIINWSAEDVGPSGIRSYDVQTRQSATAPWQEFATDTAHTSNIYQGSDGEQVEFRCRARDVSGNVAQWVDAPSASTTIDGGNPHSYIASARRCVNGSSVSVEWGGSDLAGEIASYDIFVRDGDDADWVLWQDDVVGTADVFTGTLGHTYCFRSQARDLVGHTEPWQPLPQAAVTFYAHVLSGTVTDNRGQTDMVSAISLEPSASYTTTNSSTGVYTLYLGASGNYTIGVSAPGYGELPATELAITGNSRFDMVLPPQDDAIQNGGFETGTLFDWSVTGYDAQVVSDTRHSGDYALQINHETSGTLVISGTAGMSETLVVSRTTAVAQTVNVDLLHQPTLSFMYDIPSELEAGVFSVRVAGTASVPIFQSSAATSGWTHAWVDLSAYAEQNVTFVFELAGGVGVVWLDEISIGSWHTPQVRTVSPQKWYVPQATTLTLTGQNFIATPGVFLDELKLANVTWVSATQLSANVPETLTVGVYDLAVANPNGSMTMLQDVVTVAWRQAFLPLILQGSLNASSRRARADWTTFGYDAAHTGYNRLDPGASRYALAWMADLPVADNDRDLEQVAVADGVLVASGGSSDDLNVVALDAENGQELWRKPFPNKHSLNPPSIAHGSVYFQQGNHRYDTYLFCVDLYSGTQHWQAPFPAQWDHYLAPLIVGESVYINGGYHGGMYGFNAANGAQLWVAGLLQYDKWTPAYADGKLYTWTKNLFKEHDPTTGQALWTMSLNWSFYSYSMNTAPVIAGKTAFVSNSVGLYAIDLNTQLVHWSASGDHRDTTPAVADDVVYALNDHVLQARSISDGALLWSFDRDSQLKNAPIIAGDYVYVASDANTYVLNRSTHEVVWQTDHGGWLTVANGFLYIAQPDKVIYAYRAQEP